MVVLGGVAVSYERGSPVADLPCQQAGPQRKKLARPPPLQGSRDSLTWDRDFLNLTSLGL